MNGEAICISDLGASTVVGRDPWSAAAAVRAGIDGFIEHPFMIDAAGKPMYVAVAPWLEVDLAGAARFESLLFPAIDQALGSIGASPDKATRLALSLGMPAARPGLMEDLRSALLKAISARYRGVFTAVAAFANGHAAGLMALEAAAKEIVQGRFDACIVAGVESYIEPETLEWLEHCDQLHRGGPRNNPWGFVPGEAAAAILIARQGVAERWNSANYGRLLGLGMALEPNRIKTETICIGQGLTVALRNALRGLPNGSKVMSIYCDMNGEPYRADEYGFASLRVGEMYDSDCVCQTPADCLGDVGAASGVLFTVLASVAAYKGYSKGEILLVFCGSESGERSAVLLHMPLLDG